MFIDENSKIDREALRLHILEQLVQLKVQAHHLVGDQDNYDFWNELHDRISVQELSEDTRNKYRALESELHHLPQYIESWIARSVDSNERFEFFIAAKAEEIKSGDQSRDYFWALQIRHDQLIAVVRVSSRLIEVLQKWITQSPDEVIDDELFQGLVETNLEEQIYLEAENIHKQRAAHL